MTENEITEKINQFEEKSREYQALKDELRDDILTFISERNLAPSRVAYSIASTYVNINAKKLTKTSILKFRDIVLRDIENFVRSRRGRKDE